MPYNPQTEYRGDRYLFEGIAGAGQAIAQGVKQWRANKAESKFLDQQAELMGQLIAPKVAQGSSHYDPKIIDDLANFPSLSLAQKRGKLAGLQFLVDQTQKQQESAAIQTRHEDDMGLRRAGIELQRGQMLVGDARQRRQEESETQRARDTLGMLLGLSGQTQLPSPINPEAPGPYLQQQYPNADAKVLENLLRDFTPAAKQRMAIDQGNLDVARDQVENRRAQIDNETQRVTRKTLTPSALAAFTKAKADLRLAQVGAENPEAAASIQRDIDQLDSLMAESMPAKPEGAPTPLAPAKKFNPKTRKLE